MTTIPGKQATESVESVEKMQLEYIIDDCMIKLTFPVKSEDSTMRDIKRMMLEAAARK